MTEREIQLLLLIIKIDQEWEATFEGDSKNVLSTDNRKKLTREANMNKANLTMYSQSLFQKGCLIKDDDGAYEVNRLLIPKIVGDLVEYTFTFDLKDD